MKISEQVEAIMKAVPATRDSDKELQIIYMQKFGLNLSPEQVAKFRQMPALETLRRSRQAIQMEGKYPASPKVDAERYVKFNAMQAGGYVEPETILEQRPELEVFFPQPEKKIYRPLDWKTDEPPALPH